VDRDAGGHPIGCRVDPEHRGVAEVDDPHGMGGGRDRDRALLWSADRDPRHDPIGSRVDAHDLARIPDRDPDTASSDRDLRGSRANRDHGDDGG
jgi:hypothetical protein